MGKVCRRVLTMLVNKSDEGRTLNLHDIYQLQIIREVAVVVIFHPLFISISNPSIFPASS